MVFRDTIKSWHKYINRAFGRLLLKTHASPRCALPLVRGGTTSVLSNQTTRKHTSTYGRRKLNRQLFKTTRPATFSNFGKLTRTDALHISMGEITSLWTKWNQISSPTTHDFTWKDAPTDHQLGRWRHGERHRIEKKYRPDQIQGVCRRSLIQSQERQTKPDAPSINVVRGMLDIYLRNCHKSIVIFTSPLDASAKVVGQPVLHLHCATCCIRSHVTFSLTQTLE